MPKLLFFILYLFCRSLLFAQETDEPTKNASHDYLARIKKIKLLWEQDKPIQAMKIAKESLKLAHTKHGENSYPACAIQELLASMQSRRALYKEAKENFLQAIDKCRKLPETREQQDLLSSSLSQLSEIQEIAFHQYSLALKLQLEAVVITRKLHGNETKKLINKLCSLISIYRHLQQYSKLAPLMEEYQKLALKFTKEFTIQRLDYHSAMTQAYDRLGLRKQSVEHGRKCLQHRRKLQGEKSIFVTDTATNLAMDLLTFEQEDEAEELLLEAMEIRRTYSKKRKDSKYIPTPREIQRDKSRGENIKNYLFWPLSLLATHYAKTANYAKAEYFFLESIKLMRENFDPHYGGIFNNERKLALLVYLPQKKEQKAEALLQKGLASFKDSYGEQDFRVAVQLCYLGELMRKCGKLDKSQQHLQQAMKIWRGKYNCNNREYTAMLSNLALIHEARGQYALALKTHQQIKQIRTKIYGENHIYTSWAEQKSANCHIKLGDNKTAQELLKKSLLLTIKSYGERHSYTTALLEKIALIHLDNKLPSHSEPLLLRALKINELSYGPDHSKTAKSLHQLARAKNAMGQCKEADSFILQCLSVHAKKLGLDQEQTLDALGGFHFIYGKNDQLRSLEATLDPRAALGLPTTEEDSPGRIRLRYDQRGKLKGLESDLKQILADREKALGPKHPDVAVTLKQMAILHLMRGRAPLAEALLRRSLSIEEKHYGNQHPLVASTLSLLAQCLVAQGRDFLAEPLLKQALAANTKAYGENSRECALSLENLAAWHQRQGEKTQAESLRNRAKEIRADKNLK